MFVATHAAIGALFGEMMPSHPILVFVLSFITHFFTDMIPHGDTHLIKGFEAGTGIKKAVLIQSADTLATVLFVIYLFTRVVMNQRIAVVMGVVGGVLPCLLYTSPSPRDRTRSRMPSSA